MTTAMLNVAPYVALNDSGCSTYWPSASEPGRLTITIPSGGYQPGTYVYPCPPGAQQSIAGTDGPLQLALADGRWVDIFGITGSITWNGNNGTAVGNSAAGASGILVKNWQTGTGWPTGTFGSSAGKAGFTACGATVAAGAITAEDKQLGYIAHALALVFNNNGLANGPVRPAYTQDGNGYPAGNTFYHQGQRLALPPGLTRPGGFSVMSNMICDAFEIYGGFVMDRTGGFTIRCNARAEPGVGVTLSASDFSGVTTMAAGSCGKFLFDNLRIVTNSDPDLGF
jgi:hypothetical protein